MRGMIWAQGVDGAIGRGGVMPWHLPEDLAHFRRVTRGATVIMGRRTWESLPEQFRPLPGRRNIVVTRNASYEAAGAEVAPSLDVALDGTGQASPVWIIGGGELYREAMPLAETLVVTDIDISVAEADTFAPTIDDRWETTEQSEWLKSETGLSYRFTSYERSSQVKSGTLE